MISQDEKMGESADNVQTEENAVEPLISLASALLDLDRLRVAAVLANGPANRMEMAEATGLSHRDLLRQLDGLQNFGLVKLQEPAPREPDAYSRYELNMDALKAARQAMGKYKGVRKRPSDSREMTLATFMPGGKLNTMPLKQSQIVTILDEIARKFEPEKQYTEREVNVILTDINEDYCLTRRYLVDYGYLSREKGIYRRNS
jgi:ArsR family transcriptional regulator, arsenate/arsenite/antimonite-responsive transcriptional repressor